MVCGLCRTLSKTVRSTAESFHAPMLLVSRCSAICKSPPSISFKVSLKYGCLPSAAMGEASPIAGLAMETDDRTARIPFPTNFLLAFPMLFSITPPSCASRRPPCCRRCSKCAIHILPNDNLLEHEPGSARHRIVVPAEKTFGNPSTGEIMTHRAAMARKIRLNPGISKCESGSRDPAQCSRHRP